MAIGVGVAVGSNSNAFKASAASQTENFTSFSQTSGTIKTNVLTYASYKGGGTTDPAIQGGGVRLYQGDSSYAGGMMVFTALGNAKINKITVTNGSAYDTTAAYAKGSITTKTLKSSFEGSDSVSKSGTYSTASNLNATNVTIACFGTSKSTRLDIVAAEIVYDDGTASSYTITYDNNGGSGSQFTQEDSANASVTLSNNKNGDDDIFTKQYYLCDGWGDSSHKNNATAQYSLGQSYTLSGDITLYAHWTRNSFTVTYDLNNGTGTTPTDQNTYDASSIEEVDLAGGTGFSRTGYTCDGWALTSDAQTRDFELSAPDLNLKSHANSSGVVTLYAHWVVVGRTVTKNATNCAISGPSTVNIAEDAEFTITPSTNYVVPTSVTVECGSSTLTNGTEYDYEDGTLIIYKQYIIDNISITAAGIPTYAVSTTDGQTSTVTHGSFGPLDQRVTRGEDYIGQFEPESADYTFPQSVTVTMAGVEIDEGDGSGQYEYDSSDGVLYVYGVTGDLLISADCYEIPTYAITCTTDNGTNNAPAKMKTIVGTQASFTITPNAHYKLPETIVVRSGANVLVQGSDKDYTYNSNTGAVLLKVTSNYAGAITVTAPMVALRQNAISVNLTNVNADSGNVSVVEEGGEVTLNFTPATDYALPEEITVSPADTTYTWDESTGELDLLGELSDISITIEGDPKALSSEELTLSAYSGSYTLGDAFVIPTVTAHFNTGDETIPSSEVTVTGYDPYSINSSQSVTISYTFEGVTATASYTANVGAKVLSHNYTKITAVDSITSGDYIIAYSSRAFDGRDANNAYTSVSITSGAIAGTNAMDKLAVHIEPVVNNDTIVGYTLKMNSNSDNNANKYLSFTSGSNSLAFSDSSKTMSISLVSSATHATYSSGGCFAIGDSSTCLSYNAVSGNDRFRFYKTSTTKDATNGKNYYAVDLYKKVDSGSKSLIRITAEYVGGSKYVGDTLKTSDFVVKAQYDTSETLVTLTEGVTITSGATLESTSNDVTLSYTEGGITKTVTVKNIAATERTAELLSVTLVEDGTVKKSGYLAFDAATWDLTNLKVVCDWDDDDFDETFDLQDLVDSEDATISPAKPTLGDTSFTVSYSYHEMDISNGTVALTEEVKADYVDSISWTGTNTSDFQALEGETLTESVVNGWNVVATMAGAGETGRLYFADYVLKVGTKTINSLPYTWAAEDDGQSLTITYGKKANGEDFVRANGNAKANICPLINDVNHETETEEDRTISNIIANASYSAEGKSGGGSGSTLSFTDANSLVSYTSSNAYRNGYTDGSSGHIKVYGGSTIVISSDYTIKTIKFSFTGTSYQGGLSTSAYTVNAKTWSSSNSTSSQARITGIEVVIEYSGTDTTEYANKSEHFAAQKAVVNFAKAFNAAMNAENVCSGTQENLAAGWANAALAYNNPDYATNEKPKGFLQEISSLSETEQNWAKDMIKYATARWSDNSDAACLERAMATYERCVSVYKMTAFMSEIRTVNANPNIIPLKLNSISNANTMIIAITSLVAVAAIGGYFFFRRKKED